MKRRAFLIGFSAFCVTGIAGCKTDSGDEYLGKWRAVDSNTEIMIERNGDFFTMTIVPNRLAQPPRKFPATLTKEGLLEFKSEWGGKQSASLNKSTGHLLALDVEFARLGE